MEHSTSQTGQNASPTQVESDKLDAHMARRVRYIDDTQAWAMGILDTPDAAKTSRDQARQLILQGEILGTLHILLAQTAALVQMVTPLVQHANRMIESPGAKLLTAMGRRRA